MMHQEKIHMISKVMMMMMMNMKQTIEPKQSPNLNDNNELKIEEEEEESIVDNGTSISCTTTSNCFSSSCRAK